MKLKEERLLWPDLIRIFAIYGVVALHTLGSYPEWISTYIVKIFETSVPLFVMISGALLLGKIESYKVFLKKRFVKVLFPWIIWTLFYMIFFYIYKDSYVLSTYFSTGIQEISNWGKFFLVQFLTGLWFLPLIFGLYLITPALRIFIIHSKRIDLVYILILWFIFISLLPWIFSNVLFPEWLPMFIYAPIQYLGYFILGYFLIKNINNKFLKLPIWFIFPLLAVFFILPISSFLEPATVVVTTLIFIYLYSFSINIEHKINYEIKNMLHKIGRASLGIYVVHSLIVYSLIRISALEQLSSLGLIYTSLIFILSFLIVFIIQKVPLIKYMVP